MSQYQSDYGSNISLGSTPFYAANYINLLTSYDTFYQNNIAALTATFSNFLFSDPNYTSTLSNDFTQLYAGVGSLACNIMFTNTIVNLPCISTMQFSGINSVSGAGSTWNVSYNKTTNQNQWPLINNNPALLIDSDVNPQIQTEQSYLIPVTQISDNRNGFLLLTNNSGNYTVTGFQSSDQTTTTSTSVSKTYSISDGTQYYLKAYAQSNVSNPCPGSPPSGTWCLMNTNIIITAPFTITFNTLPSTTLYNQFSFLVGDLTGALQLTNSTLPY